MDELILIEKAKKGDKAVFEELVRLHERNVYNLALKLLKNREDALDAAQESFIKAWINIDSFRGDSKFSVWIYRLTYNTCLDALRKMKKGEIISLTSEDDESEKNIPDETLTPEEEVLHKETRHAVRRAVEELPEEYRQILIMREFTEMTYSEISSATGLNEGTVKSRLSRARAKLGDILRKDGTFSKIIRQKNSEEVTDND